MVIFAIYDDEVEVNANVRSGVNANYAMAGLALIAIDDVIESS